jgi:glycosyltransferase involved in cell wall biosynthesis
MTVSRAPPGRHPRLLFVVESGTDVRLVDGLAARFELDVLARRISGGVEVSRPPASGAAVEVGPGSRAAFARLVLARLRGARDRYCGALVQGYAAAALAAHVAARLGGPPVTLLVCSPVERYYRCRREARGGAAFRWREYLALLALARANARLARRYVVLSEHLRDVVRGHGARAPVEVVPVYGVDPAVFRPAAEPRAMLRRRGGLPLDGPLALFSSRVAPEKDADALLSAIRLLRDRGRAVRVLNPSGGHAAFVAAAERHGVADLVVARDAVHPTRDLPSLVQACDLCVQASREEGLGFSPLEALACGVPVVAADVGGLRETIRDGETGWTYPRGDAEALASRIADVLDSPGEALRRTAAGQRLVADRFQSDAAFDRLASLLREGAP